MKADTQVVSHDLRWIDTNSASTPNVGNSVDEFDSVSNHIEIRDWTTHWILYSRERKRKLRKRNIEIGKDDWRPSNLYTIDTLDRT